MSDHLTVANELIAEVITLSALSLGIQILFV